MQSHVTRRRRDVDEINRGALGARSFTSNAQSRANREQSFIIEQVTRVAKLEDGVPVGALDDRQRSSSTKSPPALLDPSEDGFWAQKPEQGTIEFSPEQLLVLRVHPLQKCLRPTPPLEVIVTDHFEDRHHLYFRNPRTHERRVPDEFFDGCGNLTRLDGDGFVRERCGERRRFHDHIGIRVGAVRQTGEITFEPGKHDGSINRTAVKLQVCCVCLNQRVGFPLTRVESAHKVNLATSRLCRCDEPLLPNVARIYIAQRSC